MTPPTLRVLHLSDTTLSGSPIRIAKLLTQQSSRGSSVGVQACHIVWDATSGYRTFETDLVGSSMSDDELRTWLAWPDIIHYHNRYARQQIFKKLGISPPKKPSVIQMHSDRHSGLDNFEAEAKSGVPIAVIAQYHTRQWPEATYLVPNVVDINAPEYQREPVPLRTIPVVSYAPSNWTCKGFDDKGYGVVMPILKRMKFNSEIYLQLIVSKPHDEVMLLKRGADIGIDEIVTGSYHLSSLEFLAMGVPCFANLDEDTAKTVKQVTGCAGKLPWLKANPATFKRELEKIIRDKSWQELGEQSRRWMERYWAPDVLVRHYEDMYLDILGGS